MRGSSVARALSALAFAVPLFVASPARAIDVLEAGHFVVGMAGTFGMEMNGPKLVVGWEWPRAQVTFALSGGALIIPLGPGVGGEISAEWVLLPSTPLPFFAQSSVGAVVGAHLGAKFTALSHPKLHLEGIGEYTNGTGITYAFASVGFPQVLEMGVGQRRLLKDGLGPYAELRLGVPLLVNAEVGLTSVTIR